jgi:S1-C subfamily serine protease
MAGKPWIGFAVRKAPGKNTLLVQDVAENGPAEKSGLRSGDELSKIDGKPVPDINVFKGMFKNWVQASTAFVTNE